MRKLTLLFALLSSLATVSSAAMNPQGFLSWTQSGSVYSYKVELRNFGTVDIGTFWYAWIPGQNYMPVAPTNIQSPAGWTATITHGGSTDGWGIQWKGGAVLQPGDINGGFRFDSTATPAQLLGASQFHGGPSVGTSFVYEEGPFLGQSKQFVVTQKHGIVEFTTTPNEVVGGTNITAEITLAEPAPTGGTVIPLNSSHPSAATVPSSITVSAGQTSKTFTIVTHGVNVDNGVNLSATTSGESTFRFINVKRAIMTGFTLSADLVTGGSRPLATITLNGLAGPSHVLINMSDNSPSITTAAAFNVTSQTSSRQAYVGTSPVTTTVNGTVTAKQDSITMTKSLTILPPGVFSLTLPSGSVTGGATVTATLTLKGPAPVGGWVVNLSSTDPTVASVPPTLTFAAGQKVKTFTVTTFPTGTSKTVTIRAVKQTSRQVSLTVTP